jgi:hypothetical protein
MPILPANSWIEMSYPDAKKQFRLVNEDAPTPWIRVCEAWTSTGVKHLQITAEGRWKQEQILECQPDGLQKQPFPTDKLPVVDCPVGALIGKFGGSSSSLGPASALPGTPPSPLPEGKAFAIGSYCLVAVPANSLGPLFVSFNLPLNSSPVHIDELTITVKGAPTGS